MSIQVKNLTHIYEKGMPNESIALENISFEVEDGSFLGVIGHTGSGKSTLLQHLNGLLKPTEGTIVIGGVDITSPDVSMVDIRKRIGLVFQYPEYQLFEETVKKEIMMLNKYCIVGLLTYDFNNMIHIFIFYKF